MTTVKIFLPPAAAERFFKAVSTTTEANGSTVIAIDLHALSKLLEAPSGLGGISIDFGYFAKQPER